MDRFYVTAAPIQKEKTWVTEGVRISVITDRILRLERSVSGTFVDQPTQKIMARDFGTPEFQVTEKEEGIFVRTRERGFLIRKGTWDVSVHMGSYETDSRKVHPIGGTFRTLDNALGDRILFGENKGKVQLADSIFSMEGVTEIDDSASYLLEEDGTLTPREPGAEDRYILAFGKDYLGGLREFYGLTGFTPLLPKYALGNWWSRYYAYRQQEYIDLMDKFAEKGIPLTVATIDMDWHLVKNVPKDATTHSRFWGKGWTGYTFDENLFPDHRQFFLDLKQRNLAITMNLHPHDGIRYFEEQYEAMAEANHIDKNTKTPVEFDFTDRQFVDSYFDLVLHPYEDEGVDFWWIDWQQGRKSQKAGLDPLWLLNHYHTLDAGRNGRTAMILSRYSGCGSHRYPLGFSGDTIVRWKSLVYQPKFTIAAANTGYSWWSHDIGGHMGSKGEPELYTRWVQLGVFSPINRLHSTRDKWSKEPWLYGEEAERIVTEFLRLRHRLLPYLYTANVRTAKEGLPLVMPMYYMHDCREAYEAEGQFYFGTEMIVSPVVSKRNREGVSMVNVWLPEGNWTDFFTEEVYEGGRNYELQVPLDRIPVFVKEGGIIPMLAETDNNSQEFTNLEVRMYAGNGIYRMEDELGGILFEIKREDDGVKVQITKDDDSITTHVKCRVIGDTLSEIQGNLEVTC